MAVLRAVWPPIVGSSACATAQLHTEAQLNDIARSCGLSYGEIVQEAEETRLLFLYRVAPKPEQRHCVYQWARKNHMHLVVINAINEPQVTVEEPKS